MCDRAPPDLETDCAVFFDVDGTLVELIEDRDAVRFDPRLRALLGRLRDRLDGALALVSGRGLADLDRITGNLEVACAAEHGAEVREAGGRRRVMADVEPERWHRVLEDLRRTVARYPGLDLEEKGLGAALHYRAAPELAEVALDAARRAAERLGADCRLRNGKMVVEISPHGAHKGQAIKRFLEDPPFRGRRPVFIGDDVTDEDGFESVNARGGVSVKVGPGRTSAGYRLGDVAAVIAWLERQAGLLESTG